MQHKNTTHHKNSSRDLLNFRESVTASRSKKSTHNLLEQSFTKDRKTDEKDRMFLLMQMYNCTPANAYIQHQIQTKNIPSTDSVLKSHKSKPKSPSKMNDRAHNTSMVANPTQGNRSLLESEFNGCEALLEGLENHSNSNSGGNIGSTKNRMQELRYLAKKKMRNSKSTHKLMHTRKESKEAPFGSRKESKEKTLKDSKEKMFNQVCEFANLKRIDGAECRVVQNHGKITKDKGTASTKQFIHQENKEKQKQALLARAASQKNYLPPNQNNNFIAHQLHKRCTTNSQDVNSFLHQHCNNFIYNNYINGIPQDPNEKRQRSIPKNVVNQKEKKKEKKPNSGMGSILMEKKGSNHSHNPPLNISAQNIFNDMSNLSVNKIPQIKKEQFDLMKEKALSTNPNKIKTVKKIIYTHDNITSPPRKFPKKGMRKQQTKNKMKKDIPNYSFEEKTQAKLHPDIGQFRFQTPCNKSMTGHTQMFKPINPIPIIEGTQGKKNSKNKLSNPKRIQTGGIGINNPLKSESSSKCTTKPLAEIFHEMAEETQGRPSFINTNPQFRLDSKVPTPHPQSSTHAMTKNKNLGISPPLLPNTTNRILHNNISPSDDTKSKDEKENTLQKDSSQNNSFEKGQSPESNKSEKVNKYKNNSEGNSKINSPPEENLKITSLTQINAKNNRNNKYHLIESQEDETVDQGNKAPSQTPNSRFIQESERPPTSNGVRKNPSKINQLKEDEKKNGVKKNEKDFNKTNTYKEYRKTHNLAPLKTSSDENTERMIIDSSTPSDASGNNPNFLQKNVKTSTSHYRDSITSQLLRSNSNQTDASTYGDLYSSSALQYEKNLSRKINVILDNQASTKASENTNTFEAIKLNKSGSMAQFKNLAMIKNLNNSVSDCFSNCENEGLEEMHYILVAFHQRSKQLLKHIEQNTETTMPLNKENMTVISIEEEQFY